MRPEPEVRCMVVGLQPCIVDQPLVIAGVVERYRIDIVLFTVHCSVSEGSLFHLLHAVLQAEAQVGAGTPLQAVAQRGGVEPVGQFAVVLVADEAVGMMVVARESPGKVFPLFLAVRQRDMCFIAAAVSEPHACTLLAEG